MKLNETCFAVQEGEVLIGAAVVESHPEVGILYIVMTRLELESNLKVKWYKTFCITRFQSVLKTTI